MSNTGLNKYELSHLVHLLISIKYDDKLNRAR